MASHKGNPDAAPLPEAWGVLYAKPNPDSTAKVCANCIMWSYEDQRCSIHAADVEVPYNAICGYHVFGAPMEIRMEHPGMEPVDPKFSGLEVVPNGTFCGNCIYYEPTATDKGNCWAVAKKDGKPPQPVDFLGCCARWVNNPAFIPPEEM